MAIYPTVAARVRKMGGGSVKSCHIADVRASLGLTTRPAYNRIDPVRRKHPCPESKRDFIVKAMRELGMVG